MTLTSQTSAARVTPAWLRALPLILGILILLAYFVAPFISQPERGPSSLPTITSSRDSNELDLLTNGLILLPLAASITIALGIWNLVNPQLAKATAVISAICGGLMLQYGLMFVLDGREEGLLNTWLEAATWGLWALLIGAGLLILQALIPRAKPAPEFRIGTLIANQESAIILALLAIIVLVGTNNPRFLSTRNVLDILQGNAYIAVAAIGMSMVIITGNIDISVGSLIGVLAVVSGRLAVAGAPMIIAWLVPLLLGAVFGALLGWLVAYLRIPAIVVTLGMLSILKGGLILWTNGQRVTNMPPAFFLAQTRPLGVPMPVWFMLILTLLAAAWMRYSPRGRALYAVGGNADAARLSGLSEPRIVFSVFVISGVFAGIASVLYATQLRVIQATPPPALELAIITAAVVGGVSILGGKGTVIGATLAAILLNAIRSGMIFVGVSPFWIQAIQGLLILATVLTDLSRRQTTSGPPKWMFWVRRSHVS
ncbi:MAG: ABC transporter permease [Deinococcota bacterium]